MNKQISDIGVYRSPSRYIEHLFALLETQQTELTKLMDKLIFMGDFNIDKLVLDVTHLNTKRLADILRCLRLE